MDTAKSAKDTVVDKAYDARDAVADKANDAKHAIMGAADDASVGHMSHAPILHLLSHHTGRSVLLTLPTRARHAWTRRLARHTSPCKPT